MRRTFQIALILLIIYAAFSGGDVEKYCPAGGMASLTGQIVNGRMSCQMSAINIFMFLSVVVALLIAGKLFCSFLCPLGTVGEGLAIAGARLKLARMLPRGADIPLRAVKYVLLWFVLSKTFQTSELFCKTYDPYFACAACFPHETIWWAASIAIAVVVLGGLLGRMFWCKYACFFAAAQNSVTTIAGAALGGLYLGGSQLAGKAIDYDLFFGLVCFGGYCGELYGQRILPIIKVKRSQDSCTDCGACNRVCPQGIVVTDYERVTHVDCHLCGTCVEKCPVSGALSYAPRGNKWVAPALVVICVLLAFGAASQWGEQAAFATVRFVPDGLTVDGETVAVFERHGVRSIHCWGSSMSFMFRLGKRKPDKSIAWNEGILGAETYAATKTFRIFYDPRKVTEKQIQSMIFKAGEQLLQPVLKASNQLSEWQIGVFGVVDDYDLAALKKKLAVSPFVYAFTSIFGEPIKVSIFYDGTKVTKEELKKLIEDTKPLKFGQDMLDFAFTVADEGTDGPSMSRTAYIERFFPLRKRVIARADDDEERATYAVAAAGLDDPTTAWPFVWLSWHLAPVDGVLAIRSRLQDTTPMLTVETIADDIDLEELERYLRAPKLRYQRGDKQYEKDNPFSLNGTLRRLSPAELKAVSPPTARQK